jgi:hypothetical protein
MECSSIASKRRTEVTTTIGFRLNGSVANPDHVLARSPKLLRTRAPWFTRSTEPCGLLVANGQITGTDLDKQIAADGLCDQAATRSAMSEARASPSIAVLRA